MPLIKGRPRGARTVSNVYRLREPNRDVLMLYARFIDDTADYVLNQLIETTIAKDRAFLAWLAEHPTEGSGGNGEHHGGPGGHVVRKDDAG